ANARFQVGTTTLLNGAINFVGASSGFIASGGTISGPGILTASSGMLSILSNGGNIGSSTTPLSITSGASGTKQLTVAAAAAVNASGFGNVYLTDADIDLSPTQPVVVLTNSTAGSGPAFDNTTGHLELTTPAGGIAIRGTLTTS